MKKQCAGSLLCILMSLPVLLSCNVSPGGVSMIAGDFTPPELLSIEINDSSHITLSFSKEVLLDSIQVGIVEQNATANVLYREFDSTVSAFFDQQKSNCLSISLGTKTDVTKKYGLRGTVKDENANTLTFVSFFSGFNESIPSLRISEVQVQYSKPKAEYIELYVQSDGNLGSMCLYSAHDGEEARYEFDAIDVKKGDYVVVHFRNIEESCVSETGTDISLSGGAYSSESGRDLWIQNQSARLGKTDVILLENRRNGKVLDAVLLAESKYTEWPSNVYTQAVKRAVESDAWNGSSIGDAVCSDGLTTTRTLSRQGSLAGAGAGCEFDWITTATGGATPGKENSTKEYIPKNN